MATRPETYQRTPRDEWLFAADAMRLTLAERKAMLALHAHMAEDSLEAFAGNIRMATMAGCDVRTITRGLSLLVTRGVIAKESTGGGRGNLTLYRGVIPSEKTGAGHGGGKHPSNSATAAVPSGCDGKGRAPVSDHSSPKDSFLPGHQTGAETGAETGAAPRARVPGKGKVELSTPRFAQRSPTGGAVGPDAGEKLRDFVWRLAKAFPAKRGGVPQASAALKEFIEAGHATPEEIETSIARWRPYFDACRAENGHSTGYTMRGWLESGDFRFHPSEVHDWHPEESGEFLS